MITLFRAIKFAFQDIFRNLSLSFMTVLILVLMLLSVNTLLVIQHLTNLGTEAVRSEVDVTVFFKNIAPPEKVTEVIEFLETFPEVTSVEFTEREKVLEEFRTSYQDNEGIIEALEELPENPLGPKVVVKAADPADYPKIITALSIPEYENVIEDKTLPDTEQGIRRIDAITSQVELFSLAVSVLFTVISFIIIFNTIRVAIFTHKMEITIKKLVGASNWFIRAPYIIESFIFSLISVLIAGGVVALFARITDPYVSVVFGGENILTSYFQSRIIELAGIEFVAVFFLTACSSLLAMSRYLKA